MRRFEQPEATIFDVGKQGQEEEEQENNNNDNHNNGRTTTTTTTTQRYTPCGLSQFNATANTTQQTTNARHNDSNIARLCTTDGIVLADTGHYFSPISKS